jgi:hypothetical protein
MSFLNTLLATTTTSTVATSTITQASNTRMGMDMLGGLDLDAPIDQVVETDWSAVSRGFEKSKAIERRNALDGRIREVEQQLADLAKLLARMEKDNALQMGILAKAVAEGVLRPYPSRKEKSRFWVKFAVEVRDAQAERKNHLRDLRRQRIS